MTRDTVEDLPHGAALGAHRFTFAVVADSHMNPKDDATSSPWVTNKLANDRTRWVIQSLNRHNPAFVIHLGDMIHPVPVLPSYGPAADRFHHLMTGLESKLYLVSGNHDVGDKPVSWMPAGNVSEENVALYRKHFGSDTYSFDHEDCHFAVINAQIVNSGFACEGEQRVWLEEDLAAHKGQRLMICTHYPPFVAERNEGGHYDNLDEPGRTWLLELLERHKVEALFAGHVHNWFYNRVGATECYVLPSIAFVRHDYTEMFRIGPGPEEGRDDFPKLGYFLVDVYEHGHVAHNLRTYGARLAEGETLPLPAPARLPPRHGKAPGRAPLGVDLRHPWAEWVNIPYSGAVDEFTRKLVRNDYPLLALWEMGLRKLRLPLQDLLDDATWARMIDLHAVGHTFTVFQYGVPQGEALRLLMERKDVVSALEIVLRWSELEENLSSLATLAGKSGLPVYLSKLRTSADSERDGSRFHHFITHGFRPDERETLEALLGRPGVRDWLAGFVFRIGRGDLPWTDVPAIAALARNLGVLPQVQVRLASDNPAEPLFDERANTNRVAETVSAAWVCEEANVFLDTFVDLDRGYFPRTGLIDRRHNPRDAGRVVAHLQTALEQGGNGWRAGVASEHSQMRLCVLERENPAPGQGPALMVLPKQELALETLPVALASLEGRGNAYDLVEGTCVSFVWHAKDEEVHFEGSLSCVGPTLLLLGE